MVALLEDAAIVHGGQGIVKEINFYAGVFLVAKELFGELLEKEFELEGKKAEGLFANTAFLLGGSDLQNLIVIGKGMPDFDGVDAEVEVVDALGNSMG